jgi:hypothetical protein
VAEWAERNGEGTGTARISATNAAATATDSWDVTITGRVIHNVMGNASAWVLSALVSVTAVLRTNPRQYHPNKGP